MLYIRKLAETFPIVRELQEKKGTVWINENKRPFEAEESGLELGMADIDDAEERLEKFAPFIRRVFPETEERAGIIESELTPVPKMQEYLNGFRKQALPGRLLLKQDNDLPIAGSVKARGGIYEVLKHTEELALEHGMIAPGQSYEVLAENRCREFFSQYTIQVGSTGNLGLSIGIMSAVIGYNVIVHMSADAREWKKDLLRSYGVKVMEYETDYSEAVKNGRRLSEENPKSYFVDDENSRNLFLGYAVAAKRLAVQLENQEIKADASHPLFVYIPCGVGGAPGGITFGLKEIFGDMVHCFFVEPVQAPCMLLGMATGLNQKICVQDIGLDGLTHADGLAVGRPSGFVGNLMKSMLSGIITVEDKKLYDYMRRVLASENIFLEPSACAAIEGTMQFMEHPRMRNYIRDHGLEPVLDGAVHILWATGGRLVPEDVRRRYEQTYL